MSDAPAPFVTPDVDVRDLDGFMLNVERLLASELWALSTGDEFKAAMALWCRAWKQLPAGSLPNDDKVLAAFSGAGKAWPKVREMALRGFVLCGDGRLYHRVLCEDVKRAAQKKKERRERTKAATEARQRQRDEGRNDQRDVERDVEQEDHVTTSQRQGQGRKQEEPPPSSRAPPQRGHRLPAGWVPSDEDAEFARREGLSDAEISRESAKFRDHWLAKPGRNSTSLDWSLVWHNWIRRRADGGLNGAGRGLGHGERQGPPSFAEALMRAVDRDS